MASAARGRRCGGPGALCDGQRQGGLTQQDNVPRQYTSQQIPSMAKKLYLVKWLWLAVCSLGCFLLGCSRHGSHAEFECQSRMHALYRAIISSCNADSSSQNASELSESTRKKILELLKSSEIDGISTRCPAFSCNYVISKDVDAWLRGPFNVVKSNEFEVSIMCPANHSKNSIFCVNFNGYLCIYDALKTRIILKESERKADLHAASATGEVKRSSVK